MKKRLIAGLLAGGLMAAMLPGVASAGGAEKFPLLGPAGSAVCDGSEVISGAPGGFGFVFINAPASGTVAATVLLTKREPNTAYRVLLIQGDADCDRTDGTITTNKKGNGTIHLTESSVTGHAFVSIFGGGAGFVTETYFH